MAEQPSSKRGKSSKRSAKKGTAKSAGSSSKGGRSTRMETQDAVRSLTENMQRRAGVEGVYGEPITTNGKTVIPVARVMYGFGMGSGKRGDLAAPEGDEGSGGGGGVSAGPVGVVEITEHETRFIPFGDRRKLIGMAIVGFLVGIMLARR